MTDLQDRFSSLSTSRAPDLWSEIQDREPRPLPSEPRWRRGVAATVALVVAAAGIGLAALTFGGTEQQRATGASGVGAAVANGSIAFARGEGGGYHLAVLHPDGAIEDLTASPGGGTDLGPEWSPDGTRVAFLRYTNGDYELSVADPDGGEVVDLDQPAEDFSWAPDGQAIAYTSFQTGSDLDIFISSVDGSGRRALVASPLADVEPTWSPNGDRIAFIRHPVLDRDPGDADIFLVRPDGTGLTRLTDSPVWESSLAWSPDSTQIAYVSERDGDVEIHVMNADGSGKRRLTDAPTNDVASFSWSPDGTTISFEVYTGTDWDIYVVNADGTGQMAVADSPRDEVGAEWSPDGTLLAFAAAESASRVSATTPVASTSMS